MKLERAHTEKAWVEEMANRRVSDTKVARSLR